MKALRREGLAEHERTALRRKLELFMREHPLRIPLRLRIIKALHAARFTSHHLVPNRAVLASALALFLCTSIGTSYAAEKALPGDALYFVKVNVNEPIVGALTVSTEHKAQWNVALAERRLEEVEALAAEGRLQASDSETMAALVRASKLTFDTRVSALATMDGTAAAVADARSELRSSLAAHAYVLKALGEELPDVRPAIAPVIAVIEESEARVEVMRGSTTPSIPNAGVEDEDSKKLLDRKRKRALEQIEEVRTYAHKVRDEIGTSTYAIIADSASTTAKMIDETHRGSDEGNYREALGSFTESIQAAKEMKAKLQAAVRVQRSGKSLRDDFLTPRNGDDDEKMWRTSKEDKDVRDAGAPSDDSFHDGGNDDTYPHVEKGERPNSSY